MEQQGAPIMRALNHRVPRAQSAVTHCNCERNREVMRLEIDNRLCVGSARFPECHMEAKELGFDFWRGADGDKDAFSLGLHISWYQDRIGRGPDVDVAAGGKIATRPAASFIPSVLDYTGGYTAGIDGLRELRPPRSKGLEMCFETPASERAQVQGSTRCVVMEAFVDEKASFKLLPPLPIRRCFGSNGSSCMEAWSASAAISKATRTAPGGAFSTNVRTVANFRWRWDVGGAFPDLLTVEGYGPDPGLLDRF